MDEKRTISLLGAVSIGIGGMVGGGIFAVLGLAALIGGAGTPVAFALAGVVALLTAYSYAKLSVAYPSRGGSVIFIDRAFGVDFFTGSANNLLWIGYVVTLALYAVAFGNYASTFWGSEPNAALLHLLISAGILLPMLLNLLNAALISKTETYMVVVKLLILLVVIVTGFTTVEPARLTPTDWPALSQLVATGMIIFVAYEGFELIANAAEDAKNYKVTLPRAFYLSVVLVLVLYVLIAVVTVGSLSTSQIQQSQEFALAQAAEPALGQLGFTLVSVSALLATFSAINATLYGAARLSYTIATEDKLPQFIERKVWVQPAVGLFVTAGLALLLANFFDLSSISVMGSAGFLLIFAIVSAANFAKAADTDSKRWICGAGVVACLAALVGHTVRTKPSDLLVLLGMVGLALTMEGSYLAFKRSPEVGGRIQSQETNYANSNGKTK